MKPMIPNTKVGLRKSINDIHHKTQDAGYHSRQAISKAMKRAHRQQLKRQAFNEAIEFLNNGGEKDEQYYYDVQVELYLRSIDNFDRFNREEERKRQEIENEHEDRIHMMWMMEDDYYDSTDTTNHPDHWNYV